MSRLITLVALLALTSSAFGHSPFTRQQLDLTLEDTLEDSFARDDDEDLYNGFRLPTTTKPINYRLQFTPYFEPNFYFDGIAEIQIQANDVNVSQIVLHALDLTIGTVSVSLNGVGVALVTGSEYTFNETLEFMYINLQNALVLNQTYLITVVYTAPLRNDMYGFYRNWFTTDGVIRWMGSTQFQATHARKAFPCYDEPSFKATFDIIIRRLPAFTTWSNMRLLSSSAVQVDGRIIDTFYTTPYMSTYLLAFIVAEYSSIQATNANGQLVYEVIARPNAINTGQGEYAFDVGQRLLAWMDNQTGIAFSSMDPNIKMTQAAIPDFSAGAMENWGLLTYREAYLMYNENHTSSFYKQVIAYILSHEIAHMWYGNLVTCDWWDHLWLNEGFARYYQYFITNGVETEMGFETRFISEQVFTSFAQDGLYSSHPLSNVVSNAASVSAHFSTLTYNKGAAIIRMTRHLLGASVWEQGLTNYLTTRGYDTATPTDLFAAWDAAAVSNNALSQYYTGFTIDEYFRTFSEQGGLPLVTVNVEHGTGNMVVTQTRFHRDLGYSAIEGFWLIPVSWASASNPDFEDTKPNTILTGSVNLLNKGSSNVEWVIFNKQVTSYYKINYDNYTWDLITGALRSTNRTVIHEYNRAQVVEDVFSFARAGLMTYTRAFNILSFLEYETSFPPWDAARVWINWINNRLRSQPAALTGYRNLIASWASTAMTQLTYIPSATENFMTTYLRYRLAPIMCNIGVQACITSAVEQWNNLVNNGVEVHVDNRNWVYCNGLRQGGGSDFDFLWNRFVNHPVYTEKILILTTLGCTSNATSLQTYLDYITEDNYLIRPQDYSNAFASAAYDNPDTNPQIVFEWVQNPTNLAKLMNAFSNVATPLSYVSSYFTTDAQIDAFIAWATTNQNTLGTAYATVVANAESTRTILRWAEANVDDINNYVTNGYQEVPPATDLPIEVTTTPTTVTPADYEEPTPSVPDSASTFFVGIITLTTMTFFSLFTQNLLN